MHSDDWQQNESCRPKHAIALLLVFFAVTFNHVVLAMAFFGNTPDFLSFRATAVPDATRQDQLEHMLIHDCGSCHGLNMTGGLGSPLTVDALRNKPKSYLVTTISEGIPDTPMPGWAPLLSDEDIEWLVARLLKGDKP
jgi:cytochrome c55X